MVLTLAQLQSSLFAVVNYSTTYSAYITDFYSNLYSTGCRPTEMMDGTRWSQGVGPDWVLQPSKNNNPRIIQGSQLTTYFKNQLLASVAKPYPCSYEKMLYYFEMWYQYQPCFIGARSVDLYLFRHHFVKQLANSGMSVPAITAYMGWVNPLMAENYINSVISTP